MTTTTLPRPLTAAFTRLALLDYDRPLRLAVRARATEQIIAHPNAMQESLTVGWVRRHVDAAEKALAATMVGREFACPTCGYDGFKISDEALSYGVVSIYHDDLEGASSCECHECDGDLDLLTLVPVTR